MNPEETDPSKPPAAPAAEPLARGSFATYPLPGGAVHLVYRIDGQEEAHQDIPRWVVANLQKLAAGQTPEIPGVPKAMMRMLERKLGAGHD